MSACQETSHVPKCPLPPCVSLNVYGENSILHGVTIYVANQFPITIFKQIKSYFKKYNYVILQVKSLSLVLTYTLNVNFKYTQKRFCNITIVLMVV